MADLGDVPADHDLPFDAVRVAAVLEAVKHPHKRLPTEIEGVPLPKLLDAMRSAFLEHGSPRLAEALERDAEQILKYAENPSTLEDLLSELTGTPGGADVSAKLATAAE